MYHKRVKVLNFHLSLQSEINKWEYVDKAKEEATLFLLPNSFSYIYLLSNANTFALTLKEQTDEVKTTISGVSLIADSHIKSKNFKEEIKTLKEVPVVARYLLLFLPIIFLIAGVYFTNKLKIVLPETPLKEYALFILWGIVYVVLLLTINCFTAFKLEATLSSPMMEQEKYKFLLALDFSYIWLIIKVFLYAFVCSFIGWWLAAGIKFDKRYLSQNKKIIKIVVIIIVLVGSVLAFVAGEMNKNSSLKKAIEILPWMQKEYLAAVCVDKNGVIVISLQFDRALSFTSCSD